jgi:hypothetical protein
VPTSVPITVDSTRPPPPPSTTIGISTFN